MNELSYLKRLECLRRSRSTRVFGNTLDLRRKRDGRITLGGFSTSLDFEERILCDTAEHWVTLFFTITLKAGLAVES